MKDFIEIFLWPSLLGVVMIILLVTFVQVVENKSCANYEQTTSRNTQWDFWGGCYVESKGTWYTMAEYQSSIAASDALTLSDGE